MADLLEGYRRKNADLAVQRQQREERGIRLLAVTAVSAPERATVTADLDQASLAIVVRRILGEARVPYVVESPGLHGRVTAQFDALALVPALNLLLEPHRYVPVLIDGAVRIRFAPAASATTSPTATITTEVPLKHVSAERAVIVLTHLYLPGMAPPPGPSSPPAPVPGAPAPGAGSGGLPYFGLATPSAPAPMEHARPGAMPPFVVSPIRFAAEPQTNRVILSGPAAEVQAAATVLREMDHPPSHVVIEALVVEFDSTALERLQTSLVNFAADPVSRLTTNLGSSSAAALAFRFMRGGGANVMFSAMIDVLVSQERARVISRPYLAAISGQKATINITNDRYVVIQIPVAGVPILSAAPVTSGVILNITPTVLQGESIRMEVLVEDSQFIDSLNAVAQVDKNQATTTMQVDSGESIIIGGLVLDRRRSVSAGLPWLRTVPLLNLLFAQHEQNELKSEVMIFLTPHLWAPGMDPPLVVPETFKIKDREILTPIERRGF